MESILDRASPVRVERVSLRGPGVIVLAGPSGCGKGEVAAALGVLASIPSDRHLSMGDLLRRTVRRAREDAEFAAGLERDGLISATTSVLDCIDTTPALSLEVGRHLPDLDILFRERHPDGTSPRDFVSQLDWLEFCTRRGLLVPDRWTQYLMATEIDALITGSEVPLIVDGHPRTVAAAQQLVGFLEDRDWPVLKVLHLQIDRAEMEARAAWRGRADDDADVVDRRHAFYVEHVEPAIEYMARVLGADVVEAIDANQPAYETNDDGERVLDRRRSIGNVVGSVLRSLGVPPVIARDLLDAWRTDEPGGDGPPRDGE